MPRYAVLLHERSGGSHYDLLLEAGDVLKTWALESVPTVEMPIACEALPDHRMIYLEYEGPISGDRGVVSRWDQGSYLVLSAAENEWVVEFSGARLQGQATLRRSAEESGKWLFHWRMPQ